MSFDNEVGGTTNTQSSALRAFKLSCLSAVLMGQRH